MKRIISWLSLAVVIGLVAGCSWESPGTDETWNSSEGWVNFNGVYRNPGGGAMVLDYTLTPGDAASTNKVSGEIVEKGVGAGETAYGGTFSSSPVVIGSVAIVAGGYVFNDNGDGTLTGTAATDGAIDYDTGAWSIDLKMGIIPRGEAIIASYAYVVGGTAGKVDPGSTGTTIFTMTIQQIDNLLQFTDSDGMVYTGRLQQVSSTRDGIGNNARALLIGTFEVRGFSSSGRHITIYGTLTATQIRLEEELGAGGGEDATTASISYFYLADRRIDATWTERDGGGNISRTGDVVGTTTDIAEDVNLTSGGSGGGGAAAN